MAIAPRDENRVTSLTVPSAVDRKTLLNPTATPITGVDPLNVAIVDGAGSQITSFGGGTQYTDAGTPPAHPVGPTLQWDEGGTWRTVSTAKPLPVTATVSTVGLATSTIQTDGTQKTQIVGSGGGGVTVTGGKLDVNATASLAGTAIPISGATTAVGVAIVDGSGNQITSFGGGTQYTDGGAGVAHPVGTAIIYQGAANAPTVVSAANPLPVSSTFSPSGTQDVNLTKVGGAAIAIGQQLAAASLPVILPSATITTLTPPAAITNFANETGGNLAAIKAKTDNIPAQGQALAAASLPVVLTAAQVTTLTPPAAITGFAIEAGHIATVDTSTAAVNTLLGAKTDAKSTATDATSVSAMQVLKQISASVQAPPSQAVTGTFYQATQPVSIASAQVASGAIASGAAVSGAFADGANVTIGAKADAKSTATDTTAITVMQVLKEISYMEQNPASRAVTFTGSTDVATQTTLSAINAKLVSGTDIGDVTINNSTGAAAVNIQDGGNTITVDGTVSANATLAAETTKVIGTVRNADGSGNLWTSNSTTYTAKFGQDSNLLGTLGTAFSTAGKVDVKGADGDVFVRQTTAANLNATVVGTGTFEVQATPVTQADTFMLGGVNIKEINAVAPLMGNGVTGTGSQRVTVASDNTPFPVKIDQTTPGTTNAVSLAQIGGTTVVNGGTAGSQAVGGIVANNGTINSAVNPILVGGQAVSSENAVNTTAKLSQLVTDLVGKLIVLPYANPENFVSGAITSAMTGTTSTSLIAAPAAGLRNYITNIVVSNSHATVGTDVIIQDGSGGTTLYTIPAAAAYGGATITFPVPLRQPTTATALYCANVTTGSSIKVSASGYKGV